MMAKGRCRKCGEQFMYCSDTVERATKFLSNAIENHNYYNHPTLWQRWRVMWTGSHNPWRHHPTLWQRVKAWWRR